MYDAFSPVRPRHFHAMAAPVSGRKTGPVDMIQLPRGVGHDRIPPHVGCAAAQIGRGDDRIESIP